MRIISGCMTPEQDFAPEPDALPTYTEIFETALGDWLELVTAQNRAEQSLPPAPKLEK